MDEILRLGKVSQYNAQKSVETLHPLVSIINNNHLKPLPNGKIHFGFYALFLKKVKMFLSLCCLCSLLIFIFSFQISNESNILGGKQMELTSSAFDEGTMIPEKYTCDGMDISPPLKWSNVPEGTETFAIICDDPDAPMGTWVHWVLFNLPASVNELSEGVPALEILPNGAKHGRNDFGKAGYGGPCPPGGTHRYYFRVFALGEKLDVETGISKSKLLKAMEGIILAEGQLMGRYKR